MKLLLFGFIALFSVSRAQNITDASGKKQGYWSKKYPGVNVFQYKGQFKDDKPIGTFTYYYPSSKLKAVIKHIPGTNRSEAVYYHENGFVMSKGIFINLKKDSVWCNYGPSGRLSNKETYKDDLLDGFKTVYYVPEDPNDRSQFVLSLATYVQGKLNGEYTEYFEGGAVKVKGSYDMDRKSGLWTTNDVTGFKMCEEGYRNGVKHGWSMAFDENGKIIGKQYYLDGRHIQGKELETRINQLKYDATKEKK
jgi:antitoxin component YwqK of YwqJK toxin-antitoxin module